MTHVFQTSFESIIRTRNFLRPAYDAGRLPQAADEYFVDLVSQYEQTCGEDLGLNQDQAGDVYFGNSGGEQRLAQSLEGFFDQYSLITENGAVKFSSALRDNYRSFLGAGKNCPEGSPVLMRQSLAVNYGLAREQLKKDLMTDIDDEWDEIAKEVYAQESPVQNDAVSERELLEQALILMEEIRAALDKGLVDNRYLPVIEQLANLLGNPHLRLRGLKLVNLLAFTTEGEILIPPHFRGLVSAAGVPGSTIYDDLLALWDKSHGEGLFLELFDRLPQEEDLEPHSLLMRLIHAAARQPLTPAAVSMVKKTLELISFPQGLGRAERMVELLEGSDKTELIKSDPRFSKLFLMLLGNPRTKDLFFDFYSLIPAEEMPDPLLERLLRATVNYPISDVRLGFIIKALDFIVDPQKRETAAQLVELLEDPQEAGYMDDAETTGEYMITYKHRKKTGNGGNGSGSTGSVPPSSSAGPVSQPPPGFSNLIGWQRPPFGVFTGGPAVYYQAGLMVWPCNPPAGTVFNIIP